MKHTILFRVYKGDNAYIGEGIDLPIVTQGRTIDDVITNLSEALKLHLEGENFSDFGLAPT